MRVLIVEDNQRLAVMLGTQLEKRGFFCDSAAPPLAAAGETFAAAEFDVLVLDLGLPDGVR